MSITRQLIPAFDPEQVPRVPPDTDLPAVSAARLHTHWLRSRFAQPLNWEPEVFEDVSLTNPRPVREASVLIPIIERQNGLQVLLTRRNNQLQVHAGQISFPGGGRELRDASPVHTALREAEEEIGLHTDHVEPLGSMPIYTTVTGYAVTPVIAIVSPQARLRLQPSEVAEVFEVPLAFLMNPAHHELRTWGQQADTPASVSNITRRAFYAMPWIAADGQRYFIWGATAAMIRNLYRLLIA